MSYDSLIQSYRKGTEGFRAEEAELQKKKGDLHASVDHELNSAKISVLTRQAEEAIAQGKPKIADAKKLEILAIQEAVEKVKAAVQKINDQLIGIEDGKKRIAQQILDDGYLPVQQECRAKFTQAVEAVDNVWQGLNQFAEETGLKLYRYHREGLQILYLGPTRQLRIAIERWL